MLGPAPELADALADFCDFIRTDDVIVGHNVNFDINFLYDRLESELGYAFSNDFVDTMRMSRKLFPDMKNHKLSTLISEFKISDNVEHRALSDCTNTAECYNYMRRYIHDNEIYWEESPKQKPRFILILNQGCDKYDEIQYWAVADMSDGTESKVVSFTVSKAVIDAVKNQTVVANIMGNYVSDLYIHSSLKE